MNTEELRTRLHGETGKSDWPLLRPHFARGVVRLVDDSLDLVEVGILIAEDNTDQIKTWLSEEKIKEPALQQVALWETTPTTFLSVVIAPYVLIQVLAHNNPILN